MTGNLYQDWPVYVLLSVVAFFFIYLIIKGNLQSRKNKEKDSTWHENKRRLKTWKIVFKKPVISVSFEEKGIRIRIQTYLPFKKLPSKQYPKNAKYVTVNIGLPEEAIIALKKYSQKTYRLESKVIQESIEYYLLLWEIEKLPYEPLKKKQILGLKRIARTVTIEQDKRLRLLAEESGRSISELTRDAVVNFLKMREILE